MWRVCREAGRPWPILSDDPVIDYMVMEAVCLKVREQERAEAKAQERANWQAEEKERLKQMVR